MSKPDLEAEVRELCARRDIYDTICNYMRGQDRLVLRQSDVAGIGHRI